MTAPATRLHIDKKSPAYWTVTIDNPPINMLDGPLIDAFARLVDDLDADDQVKVVVFDSADADYFMAHFDLATAGEVDLTPRASGLSPFADVSMRLEHAPFATIGVLRGRARGVGSEFLQSLDMTFASRERAVISQIEVGCGLLPGGGGSERLPLLTGRQRALEIILSADDFDADTAERYGWINRAIADAELGPFVERLARRIASFDRNALAAAKKTINHRIQTARKDDLIATEALFFSLLAGAPAGARVGQFMAAGFGQRGPFEHDLGRLLADL